MYKDISANLNQKCLILPVKCAMLMFTKNFTSGNAKSAMKHSAACKSNQQINGQEGKQKKRNDGWIAFAQAYLESQVKCGYLLTLKLNDCVIHQPEEHLKRMPYACQTSAIKFTGNSVAINLCARRGQRQNISLRFVFAFKFGNVKTKQNHQVYHLQDKSNQQK